MASEAPTTDAAETAGKSTTTNGGPAPATNSGKGKGKGGGKPAADVMAGEGQEPGVAAAKAAAEGATDADAPKVRKDVVPPQYREAYKATNGTNGDFIAEELTAVTKDGGEAAIKKVKAENGIPVERWAGLNNGMQRMNLANTLRARYLRGEAIVIQGKSFDMRQQLEEFGGCSHDNDSAVQKFLKFTGLNQTERMAKAIVAFLTPKPDKAAEKAKRDAEKAEAKAKKDAERAEAKAKKEAEKKEAADKRAAEKKAKADAAAAEKAAAAKTDTK
jgi:hypothetical protein